MKPAPVNVLVTRPEHQAGELIERLKKQGFNPIKCPSIVIAAPTDANIAINKLQQLNSFDYVVFISANAAKQADTLLKQQWPETKAQIIAIGPKTQAAVESLGLCVTLTAPTPFNSEQLIADFPKTAADTNKTCLIVKGQGGREYIATALSALGITVETTDVYRRKLPVKPQQVLPNPLPFITITSQQALENLFLLYPHDIEQLKSKSTFVVLSKRIAAYAKAIGCSNISVAAQASDEGLVIALLASINN